MEKKIRKTRASADAGVDGGADAWADGRSDAATDGGIAGGEVGFRCEEMDRRKDIHRADGIVGGSWLEDGDCSFTRGRWRSGERTAM